MSNSSERREYSISELYKIAVAFRRAIEMAISDGKIKEMVSFPKGCCTYATNLLQRHLFEKGFFTWNMAGKYETETEFETHSWLETKNGIVIDITGDQYTNKTIKFEKPIYVGTRQNGFHNQFKMDEPIAYSPVVDPFVSYSAFDKRYDTVMSYYNEDDQ